MIGKEVVRGNIERQSRSGENIRTRTHVGSKAERNELCRLLHRVPGEIDVAGGHLDLAVIEGLPIKGRHSPRDTIAPCVTTRAEAPMSYITRCNTRLTLRLTCLTVRNGAPISA